MHIVILLNIFDLELYLLLFSYCFISYGLFFLLFLQAQLRQKDREIKRLEFSLRSEQHLRCELEMDLKEKCSTLEQKGNILVNSLLNIAIVSNIIMIAGKRLEQKDGDKLKETDYV